MSAQTKSPFPPRPGSVPEQEEARIIPLNAAQTAPGDAAEDGESESCTPEMQGNDADLARQVMEQIDQKLAAADDRVEGEVARDLRAGMIAEAMATARAELATEQRKLQEQKPLPGSKGKPRKLQKPDTTNIARHAVDASKGAAAIGTDEQTRLSELETKQRKPKTKSLTVEVAEDMAQAKAPPPVDYAAMPSEQVVRVQGPDGEVMFMTAAAVVAAGLVGAHMIAKTPKGEMGKLHFEPASLADLSKMFDDNPSPVYFQQLVDERKAEAEKRKQEAQAAARLQGDAPEGWSGKVEEDRAKTDALETETTV